MKDRALALFLAACMVIAMLPGITHASGNSHTVTLTCSGPGEIELLADSPARPGAEIGFTADPEEGYVAEFHCDDLNTDEILSFGDDFYGFLMPAHDVALEVRFVPAGGSAHGIAIYEGGVGSCTLSRDAAQNGECVLLTVVPADNQAYDPYFCIWAAGAELDYLCEDEDGHHYELRMGSGDAAVYIAYSEAYTARVPVPKPALPRSAAADMEQSRFHGILALHHADLHQK